MSMENFAWSLRDENHYTFIARKYEDRAKLHQDAESKRKAAEKMEAKNDPHYHRMRVEADMAQMRYEMAYLVDKNAQLQRIIDPLEYVFQRVSILEGAYSHIKLLAETVQADYNLLAKSKLKEQKNG